MALDGIPSAILRRPQVEQVTGMGRSTLYLRVQQGLFTEPVLIGPRAVGWPATDCAAINAARIAGASEDAIRKLVAKLHAARRSPVTEGEAA